MSKNVIRYRDLITIKGNASSELMKYLSFRPLLKDKLDDALMNLWNEIPPRFRLDSIEINPQSLSEHKPSNNKQ